MVNNEALRSPSDAVLYEAETDSGNAERLLKNGGMFSESSHATARGEAFNATRSMTVPDRIILAGSEQHYELPGRPRELELDDQMYNSQWSPSRVPISIQTPPRRLTLHDHSFPTADTEDYEEDASRGGSQMPSKHQQQASGVAVNNQLVGMIGDGEDPEQFLYYQGGTPAATPKTLRDRPQFRTSAQQTALQQQKPLATKGMTEKRLVELYRRLEAVEKDNKQRRYREIFVYVGIVGYVVYRSFSFMFTRSRPSY